MLAFNHIGSLGRLGNQMFEYAALRGIAASMDTTGAFLHQIERGLRITVFMNVSSWILKERKVLLKSFNMLKNHTFIFKELFEQCPDNVSLYGFFQSWRYFDHIADTIREDYTFHDEHLIPCQEMMQDIEGQEPIMLHVRRGDPSLTDPRGFKWSYTQCGDQHPVQPIEYYEKALSKFDPKQPVIVF